MKAEEVVDKDDDEREDPEIVRVVTLCLAALCIRS